MYEGLGRLAVTLETIRKMTFRRLWQKRKNAPPFPVPPYVVVGRSRSAAEKISKLVYTPVPVHFRVVLLLYKEYTMKQAEVN